MRGLNAADVRILAPPERVELRGHVAPRSAGIPGHVHFAVTCSHPNDARRRRRFGDRRDCEPRDAARNAALGFGEDSVRRIRAQVRTDFCPVLALIRRPEEILTARVQHVAVVRRDMNWRAPEPPVWRLSGGRLRGDVLPVPKLLVDALVRAVMPGRVQPAAVFRVRQCEHAVAVANRQPVLVVDSTRRSIRRPLPVLMILQTGVDVVRILVVHADGVNRSEGKVVVRIARLSPIVRNTDPAIAADDHPVGILRIEPECPEVAKHSRENATPGPATVLRIPSWRPGQENVLVVVGIDADLIEVIRSLAADVLVVAVHPGPGLTPVFGAIDFSTHRRNSSRGSATLALNGRHPRIHVFDDGVQNLGILRIEIKPDTADSSRGKSAAEFRPVVAAVAGLVNTTAGTAVHHLPGQSHLVVRRSKEDRWILWIHDQVDDADLVVEVEHLLPRFAAVGCLEDPSLRVRRIEVPQHRNVDRVRIGRVDDDPRNVVRVSETHVLPCLAGVGRLVDTVAGVGTSRGEGVASADPHNVRLRRRQRDVADRAVTLTVENGLPGRSVVRRFPHAPNPGGLIDRVEMVPGWRIRNRDVGDAHLHPERSDVPVAEGLQQILVEGSLTFGPGSGAYRQPCHDADNCRASASEPHRLTPFARSVFAVLPAVKSIVLMSSSLSVGNQRPNPCGNRFRGNVTDYLRSGLRRVPFPLTSCWMSVAWCVTGSYRAGLHQPASRCRVLHTLPASPPAD